MFQAVRKGEQNSCNIESQKTDCYTMHLCQIKSNFQLSSIKRMALKKDGRCLPFRVLWIALLRCLIPAADNISYIGNNCKMPLPNIEIIGGQISYQWYINDLPVRQKTAYWQWRAKAPGAYRISVIDSSGNILRRAVWVKPCSETI